jgi:Tfp pilus assembly protein PilX
MNYMTRTNTSAAAHAERGYTLLFAVLVTAIVLSVAISILSIARKEFSLSVSARESQFAFYAADGGLECATYYDHTQDAFSGTSSPAILQCGLMPSAATVNPVFVQSGNQATSTFTWSFETPGNYCTTVTVQKNLIYNTVVIHGSSTLQTIAASRISSRGYNVGWATSTQNCSAPSTKKVERELFFTY